MHSGLGLIKAGATIHIDNNVTPIIEPPRYIPNAIQNKVKNELQHMLDLGVIAEHYSLQKSFEELKNKLKTVLVLVYYDVHKDIQSPR